MSEQELVIPSDIPWESLKGRDLEECLYWLLDSLGAKDLEWRQGGEGQGGTDQGRDIEATFYVDSPDGELQGQQWWVEAKGRSRTVEPRAVKEAVNNTLSQTEVDVIVVATNTRFSNPTRDWVADWQQKHHRPMVRLWDRESLERMIVRHPSVVLRLFDGALSLQGRSEAVGIRFWEKLQIPSRDDLHALWSDRASLEFSPKSMLALAAGEICNGNISRRPWLVYVPPADLASLLVLAIANFPYLQRRAEHFGANGAVLTDLTVYVLMMSLVRQPAANVLSLIENVPDMLEPPGTPTQLHSAVAKHIVGRAHWDLLRTCMADCQRVDDNQPAIPEAEARQFWHRFCEPSAETSAHAGSELDHTLTIEMHDLPCSAGLSLDAKHHCPLFAVDEASLLSEQCFEAIKQVLSCRLGIARASEQGPSECDDA